MADIIQLRRDTAANWVTANPVLHDGEIGIETDTRKRKCGNGTTAWNSLPYMFSDDLDQEPTSNSHKTVESGGVKAAIDAAILNNGKGAFDISAYKAVDGILAKFDDLSQALGTNGANVPEAARKPGMSVCFVLNSDNKYVQYRLMSDTFNTTVVNWQGVDDKPTAGSDNLVNSGGVANKLAELDERTEKKIMAADMVNGFVVVDNAGNIAFRYDKNGFNAAKVHKEFVNVLEGKGVSTASKSIYENGFYLTDNHGNTVLKYDEEGLDIVQLSDHIKYLVGTAVTYSGGYHITDKKGNVALKYEDNGLDVAKISSHFLSLINLAETLETGFYIIDKNHNIGFGINKKEVITNSLLSYEIIK